MKGNEVYVSGCEWSWIADGGVLSCGTLELVNRGVRGARHQGRDKMGYPQRSPSATVTGGRLSAIDPSPSSPTMLEPQHLVSPESSRAHV